MSFTPRHKGTFRPVNREYARAVKLAAKAARRDPALAAPAIRKLERDRDALLERAQLARRLAAQHARGGDPAEAALQTATAETFDGQAAQLADQIARLRGDAPKDGTP